MDHPSLFEQLRKFDTPTAARRPGFDPRRWQAAMAEAERLK